MPGVLDWLRLFRAHTAPAEVVMVLGAYGLAGGRDWRVALALFALAHLAHFAGFGHNSVVDYIAGFDRRDPSKRHHPLPSGRMEPVEALWGVSLVAQAAGLGLSLLALLSPHKAAALAGLSAYIVWGYAYNSGLDHLTPRAWLAAGLSTGGLLVYAYALGPGFDSPLALLLFLSGVLLQAYEIGFEGSLKDLWNPWDEAPGPLRGACRVEGEEYDCVDTAFTSAMMMTRMSLYLALLIADTYAYGSSTAGLALAAVYLALILSAPRAHGALMSGDRRGALRRMGFMEVVAIYAIGLLGLPGSPAAALGLLYGLPYYLAATRLLWGETGTPRV